MQPPLITRVLMLALLPVMVVCTISGVWNIASEVTGGPPYGRLIGYSALTVVFGLCASYICWWLWTFRRRN